MERLAADDYFREAFAILGESGSEALTIAALCARLEITKGSFYHHFGSMGGFTAALLEFWEREHSERLIAISRAQPDPAQRMAGLIDIAVALPHASEAALRAWGRSNYDVAEAVARVDKRRDRHLVDAIAARGIDRPRARVLARIGMNLLVGTQQRERPVDLKKMRQMLDEVNKLIYLESDSALLKRLSKAMGR